MSTASESIYAMTYGHERPLTRNLNEVFDAIAAEWQRDKDEIERLREYNRLLILGHAPLCNARDGYACDCGVEEKS